MVVLLELCIRYLHFGKTFIHIIHINFKELFYWSHTMSTRIISGYDEYGDFFNLGDSYCFLLKSMIMLGNKVMPGSFSNRISFITVMLASILIYYHWEAMVISYLAVRTTQLPIITLQDLVKNSNLKVHHWHIYKHFNEVYL